MRAVSKYLHGTKAPNTKPQSIMEFVNRMNHRFRVPLLSSPLDSAQPTLPAGYSPDARQRWVSVVIWVALPLRGRIPPIPIPTKNLQAVNILNMPTASPLKYEPVAKAVKIIRIKVDTTRELVRDQWSEVKPKMSWPTTVPAKAISATYLAALDDV